MNLNTKFCDNFDKDKHVRPVSISSHYLFYLSFDFNATANAATLWQINEKEKIVNCIMEFPPMLSLKLQCDEINRILDEKKISKVILSGDSDSENYPLWDIVKNKFNVKYLNVEVANSNLRDDASFYLVRDVFKLFNVYIDEKCTYLINDCSTAIYNDSTNNHYLDTMRYFFHNILFKLVRSEQYV